MRLLKLLSVILTAIAVILFIATVVVPSRLEDRTAPVISMDSDQVEISVADDDTAILAGVTAQDAEDGDVTASLLVESLSNFVSPGERTATIVAFDSDNHITKATRTVHYTDYTRPTFSLSKPFSFPTGTKTENIAVNLTAQDCLDGNITRRITRTNAEGSNFNPDVPGTYAMTFSVSNSAGDVEKFNASVEIYDDTTTDLPVITLSQAMVYLPRDSAFDPISYLETVIVNGTTYVMQNGSLISSSKLNQLLQGGENVPEMTESDYYPVEQVAINNPVDPATPGWYEVSYTATSISGNVRTAYLLVRVQD